MAVKRNISFAKYMDSNATPFVKQRSKKNYPDITPGKPKIRKRKKLDVPKLFLPNKNKFLPRIKIGQEGVLINPEAPFDWTKLTPSNIKGRGNEKPYGPYDLPTYQVLSTNKGPQSKEYQTLSLLEKMSGFPETGYDLFPAAYIWDKHGQPNIKIEDTGIANASYRPFNNTIKISPYDYIDPLWTMERESEDRLRKDRPDLSEEDVKNKIKGLYEGISDDAINNRDYERQWLRNLYLAEVSHAEQYKNNRFGKTLRGIKDSIKYPGKYGSEESHRMYDTPGTIEYEAHQIIEPTLRSRYYGLSNSKTENPRYELNYNPRAKYSPINSNHGNKFDKEVYRYKIDLPAYQTGGQVDPLYFINEQYNPVKKSNVKKNSSYQWGETKSTITPSSYSNTRKAELAQSPEQHRKQQTDYFNTFGTLPELQQQNLLTKVIRRKLSENLIPYGYPDSFGDALLTLDNIFLGDFASDPKGNAFLKHMKEESVYPTRGDIFDLSLGYPQKYDSFEVSPYTPSNSRDKSQIYLRPKKIGFYGNLNVSQASPEIPLNDKLINQTELDARQKLLDEALRYLADPNVDEEYKRQAKVLIGAGANVNGLNNIGGAFFTTDLGKDDNGHYVSYWDVWDYDSKLRNLIGKPIEIYDRIYYDPETKKVLESQPDVEKKQEGGYTVKKGDTLWDLGKKYGVNWKDIAAANKIVDPKALQIGTELKIPGTKPVGTVDNNIYQGGDLAQATVTAKRPSNYSSQQTQPERTFRSDKAEDLKVDISAYANLKPEVLPKELVELPKGLNRYTQSNIVRPTLVGNNTYRSGNVGVDNILKFRQDNPDVKTIVYLKGSFENKKGEKGLDKDTLEKLGYNVEYLPIGRLQGEGEKKNFRKAVDLVKQGNALVMCEHGYDRTGAVCAQAALESGYNMNQVVEDNFWKEGDRIYPNFPDKGSDYAPYISNLKIPQYQVGGIVDPQAQAIKNQIISEINRTSAMGLPYDATVKNIDPLLRIGDIRVDELEQQKRDADAKEITRKFFSPPSEDPYTRFENPRYPNPIDTPNLRKGGYRLSKRVY